MPTVLTHPFVALALAPWLRVRVPLLVVGVLFTMLPDADTIPGHLGFALDDAWAHRGASHSLVFAAIIAGVFALLGKRAWPAVRMRTAFAFLFACAASHGLLDMLTDGGPGVALLWPFSDARGILPWRPIEVSPLDAGRFFGPRGAEVLASEFLWVWLPGLALGALGLWLRRNAGHGWPVHGNGQAVAPRGPGSTRFPMHYAVGDIDAQGWQRVFASASGEPALRRRFEHWQRHELAAYPLRLALDAESGSYLFRSPEICREEENGYLFYFEGVVYRISVTSLERRVEVRKADSSTVGELDPRMKRALLEAFALYGFFGFGSDGRNGKMRGLDKVEPDFGT